MTKGGDDTLDCLIIGGGPAGLTAAIYLARYRRNVMVVDDRNSRAALIPESHNYPGFTYGVSGEALLERLCDQARQYGATLHEGHIDSIGREAEDFVAHSAGPAFRARRILIATGIVDDSPDLPNLDDVVERGSLRYCPICDGFEALDRRIGVLGRTQTAARKALFLRTYSRDVVLLPTDDPRAHAQTAGELDRAGVEVLGERVVAVKREDEGIAVRSESGTAHKVDVLYPALGCHVRSELAQSLGAKCDDIGLLLVDDKQKTSVDGLYAAGDVVSDLHQISVGTGHAAIAATAIHNGLERNYR